MKKKLETKGIELILLSSNEETPVTPKETGEERQDSDRKLHEAKANT